MEHIMQKSRVQPCPADFRAFFRSSRLCQSTLQLTPASQHLSDAQKLPQQGLKQPAVNGHSKAVQEQSLRSLRIYRDASGVLGNSDGGGDGAGASDGAGDRGAGASDGAGDGAGASDGVTGSAGAGGGRGAGERNLFSIPHLILGQRTNSMKHVAQVQEHPIYYTYWEDQTIDWSQHTVQLKTVFILRAYPSFPILPVLNIRSQREN